MAINGMEIGSDAQIITVDSVSGQQSWNILDTIDLKQVTKQIKDTALDGTTRYAELPEGWMVDLDFTTSDSGLLDYAVSNEAQYFGGAPVGTITMALNINDASGGTASYRLTGGALKLTNAGMFKGNEKVTQKAAIVFSRMYKIS